MSIRITYVTITYNAAPVLQRTLDSVLCQDYPDIVHLIIDGASTDGTLAIVNDYIERSNAAQNGHRIHVTSEPDKGIYDAMNKGLRSLDDTMNKDLRSLDDTMNEGLRSLDGLMNEGLRSLDGLMNEGLRALDGDYVCFLNAGDFLPAPDTVSRLVGHIGDCLPCAPSGAQGDCPQCAPEGPQPAPQCAPAVLYGDTDIVDGNGHFLRHRRLSPPEHLTWKSFRQGMLVCHQAFYARTDFAIATPYDLQYRYSADVDWCIRVMKAAAKEHVPLQNLHMVVVNYTEEGQTTLHHRESLWERYHVMERHYGRVQTFLLHGWFALRSLLK